MVIEAIAKVPRGPRDCTANPTCPNPARWHEGFLFDMTQGIHTVQRRWLCRSHADTIFEPAKKQSYKDARGAVPRPAGAPLAEDAIRKGRD